MPTPNPASDRRRLAAALALLALAPAACSRERAPAEPMPEPVPEVLGALPGGRDDEPAGAPGGGTGPVATWTVPRPGAGERPAIAPPVAAAAGAGMPRPTELPPAPPALEAPASDAELLALMRAVRPDRLAADVARLVGFGTRHALAPEGDAARGGAAAAAWLRAELERTARSAASQITVEEEPFPLVLGGTTTTQRNVMATLTGIGQAKRLVYLVAHYDSRTDDVLDGLSDAPGADDNASGTAALLELARVLGGRQWDGSIRLMATAAEEQGMHGSRHHAPLARRVGLPIEGAINLDIVGGGPDAGGTRAAGGVRAFSAAPDDSPSRALARWARFVAERYGALAVDVQPTSDREGRESDHQPFAEAGFPALRLISAVEDTTRQHNARDTAERLDPDYHADVVRLAVALAGNLALAPPGAPSGVQARIEGADVVASWPAAAGDVAGYWVAVRRPESAAFELVVWEPASPSPEHRFSGLAAGGGSWRIAVAAGDARGHVGRFGDEAAVP